MGVRAVPEVHTVTELLVQTSDEVKKLSLSTNKYGQPNSLPQKKCELVTTEQAMSSCGLGLVYLLCTGVNTLHLHMHIHTYRAQPRVGFQFEHRTPETDF